MNVLFLTMSEIYDLNDHDIYQDLMRTMQKHGHSVYVVTPAERKRNLPTEKYESAGCTVLRVKTGNQSDCSLIEKGITQLLIEHEYYKAISFFLQGESFQLILYATPPITLGGLIKKLKRKHRCRTYLMLKDIFPQNAVDLRMIRKNGLIHAYFKHKEKLLYDVSDRIGCMSQANVDYLLEHNRSISSKKVEVCPNAFIPLPITASSHATVARLRKEKGIPTDSIVMVYGGNLGRPQGIPFLAECLQREKNNRKVFFLIIGSGSEYKKLDEYINSNKIQNVLLINKLPRNEYFDLIRMADIGMVFLDKRFTIPNYPSRILPYMENCMPIACVTDRSTDVGRIAVSNNYGWSCYSGDVDSFHDMMQEIECSDIKSMGKKARMYMEEKFSSEFCYSVIMK